MTHEHSKLEFRSDINGLRAWACLAVVFFHFQILNFQGGFVGVDVFFVISGYLMTAILYPKLLNQQINILQFYTQRLKRVFPALFVMLFILVSVGSFILYSQDFYHLVHEAKVALAFYYNIRFKDTDYFSEATTDWLTHTWTLGVEFQFYLLFPIILLIIYKFTKNTKHHIAILSFIAVCSFIAMQYQVHLKPNQAFFLLQYRVWEFLAGAILFLIQYKQTNQLNPKYANIILAIGWSALIAFFVLMNDAGHYPDYRTLIPVLATVAILYPIKNTFLTQNPIAQYLGSASYSIYLWHWCIYVLIGLYGYHKNITALYLFAILSIIIGCISYIFIEKGANKTLNKITNYKKQFSILMLMMILPLIMLNSIRKEGSVFWVDKNSKELADITMIEKHEPISSVYCRDKEVSECKPTNIDKEVGIILIGDSHAGAILPILDKMATEKNTSILAFISGGCPVAFNIQLRKGDKDEKEGINCLNNLNKFKKTLVKYPNAKVLIVNRNNLYLLGYNENKRGFLTQYMYKDPIDKESKQNILQWQYEFSEDVIKSTCEIAKTHQTYWFKSLPEIGFDVPKVLASNIFYRNDDSDIKIPIEEYQKRQYLIDPIQQRAKQECGVTLVDINPMLCDNEYCSLSSGRKVYYADDDHLSITGSELARPYLEFLFKP